MTVLHVEKDLEQLTLTLTASFDAPVERAWQLWADPRKLERWWGPPTYPATVVEHDLSPGGAVTYFMTGPEGDRHHGWWRIIAVDPPNGLEFEDGFADSEGTPNPDLPTTIARVALTTQAGGGTLMTIVSSFTTAEQLQQLVEMGMVEGLTAAAGQMDAILTEDA